MSAIVVILIFSSAAYVTWARGMAHVFGLVYLPVMFFLSVTRPINLPLLPDMTSQFAVGYGVIAGLFLRGGERMPFRWNVLDTLVTAMWVWTIISSWLLVGPATARNAFGDGIFDFLTPYILARAAFFSPEARRSAFWSVSICAVLVALLSPIEMRLQPQIISRILDDMGLYTAANSMPLYRFGLARAQTTFHQPMDQGNSGVIIAGFVALFAATTSIGLRDWRALLAIGAGLFISMASLSFSAFVNVVAVLGIFGLIYYMPFIGRFLNVLVVIGVIAGVAMTSAFLNHQLGERGEQFGQTLDDSMHIRTRIVQEAWPIARDAGWLGFGKDGVEPQLKERAPDKNPIKSVDNAFLLMTMQRGWPYFAIFMCIPFAIGAMTAKVWRVAPLESQRVPVMIAVAVLFSILLAMYTIFFGFVYSHLWLGMLGLFASLCDTLLGRAPVAPPMNVADPRGARLATAGGRLG